MPAKKKSVKGKPVAKNSGLSKEKPPRKGTTSLKGKSATGTDKHSTERERLEKQIIQLRAELEKERQQSNYFQLERDKIHNFWEITKSQLEENKALIRKNEYEMGMAIERHQAEIKLYEQKEKHMLFEHQRRLTELKTEELAATRIVEKEHTDLEKELQGQIHSLEMKLKDQMSSYEQCIKNLKLRYEEEITKLRDECEERVQEIMAKAADRLKKQQQEHELKHNTDIQEMEQRKTTQINKLIANHDQAFSDMKTFYNNLIRENVDKMALLKKQAEEANKNERILKKQLATLRKHNTIQLTDLQKDAEEVPKLKKQLANYKEDKVILAKVRARLKVVEKEVKDLKFHNEVLQQSLDEMKQERDELKQNCNTAILEAQRKSSLKNLILERKLEKIKADIQRGCDFIDHPNMLKDHYMKLQSYIPEKENVKQMLTVPGDVTKDIPTSIHISGQPTVRRNPKEKLNKRRGPSVRLPPIKY